MQVTEVADLSARQVYDVLELRNLVAAASGTSPLSDHVVSSVKGLASGRHFLQTEDADVVGYAHLDDEADHVAELVVSDRGDVARLLDVISESAGPSLRIWTRGDNAPLNDVLPKLGFAAVRNLLQLRLPVETAQLTEPVWPDGVAVRRFGVGFDEDAWLSVNNSAFAGHPEQASWTIDDIRAREDEAWFDPAGFFLAERDGQLVGFHWTKVHDPKTGEVYVIGVAPSMQGKRLGEALLLQGLRHLREVGVSTILLYVEEDNRSAIALYEKLGFSRWNADRQFARLR